MQKHRLTSPLAACTVSLLLFATTHSPLRAADSDQKPNILFISVDDLRPQTRADGHQFMVTPNMDRLAETGRLFHRHYVQAPTCGASRYSLLTGQYQKRPASYGNGAFSLFQDGHAPTSLPGWFRQHGYHTMQSGKISHSPDGFRDDRERIAAGGVQNTYRTAPHLHFTNPDDPEVPGAWDEFDTPVGPWQTGWGAFFAYDEGKTRHSGRSPAVEMADVEDAGYPDGLMADAAVAALAKLRNLDKPFFYALGFYKPHLPFNAPRKYWDLYDPAEIDISHVDPLARRGGEFFGAYSITPAQITEDEAKLREVIHGYYACVSYIDAQVGKVLDALDELGLADNTIIVLWGDHGFHLGELGYWGKHTLHEHSMRSAFMMRVPGMPHAGEATHSIVGSVDIYPTLVELAGLPVPDHLDGASFAETLRDPQADPIGFAIGFESKQSQTLRTHRHRLIEGSGAPRLFDHESDPGERENIAANETETTTSLREQLQALLEARKAK